MGLVIHVINHTAHCRSVMLSGSDRDDLVADVMFCIIDNDFAVLRQFRGKSSLATYLDRDLPPRRCEEAHGPLSGHALRFTRQRDT